MIDLRETDKTRILGINKNIFYPVVSLTTLSGAVMACLLGQPGDRTPATLTDVAPTGTPADAAATVTNPAEAATNTAAPTATSKSVEASPTAPATATEISDPAEVAGDGRVTVTTLEQKFPHQITAVEVRATEQTVETPLDFNTLSQLHGVDGQPIQYGYFSADNPPPFTPEIWDYKTHMGSGIVEPGYLVGVVSDVWKSLQGGRITFLSMAYPVEATGEWEQVNFRLLGDQSERGVWMIDSQGQLVGVPPGQKMPWLFESQLGTTNFIGDGIEHTLQFPASFPTSDGKQVIIPQVMKLGTPIVARIIMNPGDFNSTKTLPDPKQWLSNPNYFDTMYGKIRVAEPVGMVVPQAAVHPAIMKATN